MSEAPLSASLKPPLHGARLGSAVDAQKDRYGIIRCLPEKDTNGVSSENVKCNGLGGYVVAETGDKIVLGGSTCNPQEAHPCQFVSQRNNNGLNYDSPRICSSNGTVRSMPQIQGRDTSDGIATKVSARVPLPPFEFYVSSEQGINLCVDLDSSPLEWIESLKNEVNIHQNWPSNKSQSLQQEVGRFKDGDTEMKSSPLRNIDDSQVKNMEVAEESSDSGVNHPNGRDECLISSEVPCDGMVNILEQLEEDHSLKSPKTFSDSKNQRMSGTDTFPIDGCAMKLDSSVNNIPQMKPTCKSPVKSTSGGPCVTSSEQPRSNLCDKICENSTVASSVNLVDASAVFPKLSASYHTSSSPGKNGELPKPVGPKVIGRGLFQLGNTSELNRNTSGSHCPRLSVEKERSKTINRMDSSECSQIISFESNIVRSDGFESREGSSRKRLRKDGEVQSDCSQPVTRGRKHHAGKLLPRRSMRLVTK